MSWAEMLWSAAIFLLLFTLSLAMVATLIVWLPTQYFVEDRRFWGDKPPLVRWLGIVGKNLLGLSLVVLGIALSIPGIPGQGLLTILIGLVLVDFPGKRPLVRLIARRPWVQRNMNRLRVRFGRPPIEFGQLE